MKLPLLTFLSTDCLGMMLYFYILGLLLNKYYLFLYIDQHIIKLAPLCSEEP